MTESKSQAVVTLTLHADGDLEIGASEGIDLSVISFMIGLAQHKANMSYYGMVLQERERKRREEERQKPQLIVPR